MATRTARAAHMSNGAAPSRKRKLSSLSSVDSVLDGAGSQKQRRVSSGSSDRYADQSGSGRQVHHHSSRTSSTLETSRSPTQEVNIIPSSLRSSTRFGGFGLPNLGLDGQHEDDTNQETPKRKKRKSKTPRKQQSIQDNRAREQHPSIEGNSQAASQEDRTVPNATPGSSFAVSASEAVKSKKRKNRSKAKSPKQPRPKRPTTKQLPQRLPQKQPSPAMSARIRVYPYESSVAPESPHGSIFGGNDENYAPSLMGVPPIRNRGMGFAPARSRSGSVLSQRMFERPRSVSVFSQRTSGVLRSSPHPWSPGVPDSSQLSTSTRKFKPYSGLAHLRRPNTSSQPQIQSTPREISTGMAQHPNPPIEPPNDASLASPSHIRSGNDASTSNDATQSTPDRAVNDAGRAGRKNDESAKKANHKEKRRPLPASTETEPIPTGADGLSNVRMHESHSMAPLSTQTRGNDAANLEHNHLPIRSPLNASLNLINEVDQDGVAAETTIPATHPVCPDTIEQDFAHGPGTQVSERTLSQSVIPDSIIQGDVDAQSQTLPVENFPAREPSWELEDQTSTFFTAVRASGVASDWEREEEESRPATPIPPSPTVVRTVNSPMLGDLSPTRSARPERIAPPLEPEETLNWTIDQYPAILRAATSYLESNPENCDQEVGVDVLRDMLDHNPTQSEWFWQMEQAGIAFVRSELTEVLRAVTSVPGDELPQAQVAEASPVASAGIANEATPRDKIEEAMQYCVTQLLWQPEFGIMPNAISTWTAHFCRELDIEVPDPEFFTEQSQDNPSIPMADLVQDSETEHHEDSESDDLDRVEGSAMEQNGDGGRASPEKAQSGRGEHDGSPGHISSDGMQGISIGHNRENDSTHPKIAQTGETEHVKDANSINLDDTVEETEAECEGPSNTIGPDSIQGETSRHDGNATSVDLDFVSGPETQSNETAVAEDSRPVRSSSVSSSEAVPTDVPQLNVSGALTAERSLRRASPMVVVPVQPSRTSVTMEEFVEQSDDEVQMMDADVSVGDLPMTIGEHPEDLDLDHDIEMDDGAAFGPNFEQEDDAEETLRSSPDSNEEHSVADLGPGEIREFCENGVHAIRVSVSDSPAELMFLQGAKRAALKAVQKVLGRPSEQVAQSLEPDAPQAIADSAQTPLKLRRPFVRRTCDECERRRIRCSAESPDCLNCARDGLSCTWKAFDLSVKKVQDDCARGRTTVAVPEGLVAIPLDREETLRLELMQELPQLDQTPARPRGSRAHVVPKYERPGKPTDGLCSRCYKKTKKWYFDNTARNWTCISCYHVDREVKKRAEARERLDTPMGSSQAQDWVAGGSASVFHDDGPSSQLDSLPSSPIDNSTSQKPADGRCQRCADITTDLHASYEFGEGWVCKRCYRGKARADMPFQPRNPEDLQCPECDEMVEVKGTFRYNKRRICTNCYLSHQRKKRKELQQINRPTARNTPRPTDGTCPRCEKDRVWVHEWKFDKEELIWTCQACHRKRYMERNEERNRARDIDTVQT